MIKSLRKKFILINMLLVCLVLVIVFSALAVTNCQNAVKDTHMSLQRGLSHRDGQKSPMFELGKKPPDAFDPTPVFIIELDDEGTPKLLSTENFTVSDEDVAQLASLVKKMPEHEGTLKEYHLRYMKKTEFGAQKIAFADTTLENAAIRKAIGTSALLLFCSLLGFFAISLFLSRWALRPVERAWAQQQRFVADASHELRTPLTVILANTEILSQNRKDTIENQYRWIENTAAEASLMKRLVDDLLFLAKSDEATISPVFSQVNFSDITYSAALTFESVAYEKGIQIRADDIEQNIFVQGDTGKLQQLLAILLENAIKYSKPHSDVTVTMHRKHNKAHLSINNNGPVMDQAQIQQIFDRFYRVDTARGSEGYGLGLSIAKSITTMHKGKISADSNREAGTTFTVVLPILS